MPHDPRRKRPINFNFEQFAPGIPGLTPPDIPPRTPGFLGQNDRFDPNLLMAYLATEPFHFEPTPTADAASHFHLFSKDDWRKVDKQIQGITKKNEKWLKDFLEIMNFDYDPKKKLADTNVNPTFATLARQVFAKAVGGFFYPRVGTAYRDPATSEKLYEAYLKGGPKANKAWASAHNYGMAFDVTMFDHEDGKLFYVDDLLKKSNNKKTRHRVEAYYDSFHEIAQDFPDLIWGGDFKTPDRPHYEYHPNWNGGADGAFLLQVRKWATGMEKKVKEAALKAKDAQAAASANWLQYVWWYAGLGGQEPPKDLLAADPPPPQ